MSNSMMGNKSRHQQVIWDDTGNPGAVLAALEWAGIFLFSYMIISDLQSAQKASENLRKGGLYDLALKVNEDLAVGTEKKVADRANNNWPGADEAHEEFVAYLKGPWSKALLKVASKKEHTDEDINGLYVAISKLETAANKALVKSGLPRYLRPSTMRVRGPVAVEIEKMRASGKTIGAKEYLIAVGVENPTASQIEEFGRLYKSAPSKLTDDLVQMAMQVKWTMPSKKASSSEGPSSSSPSTFGGPSTSMTKSANVSSSSVSSAGSPEVETAQKILTALGFDTKGVDGKMGDNTRKAILAFQKKNGLPATGNLDPATMAKLKSMAPSSLAASLGGKSEGMSTGMKIGLAVAGVAAVGGLAYYFLSSDDGDDEDEVEG